MELTRRGRTHRSRIWLAAYLVCLLCVLSFIFFEVLDIDGSDLTPPLNKMETVRLAEPEHDIRRVIVLTGPELPVLSAITQLAPPAPTCADHVVNVGDALPSTDRLHRFPPALPRASLDAVPLA